MKTPRQSAAGRESEVVTLSDMSRQLDVPRSILLQMANAATVQKQNSSSHDRFQKTVLDDWLTTRIQSIPSDNLARMLLTRRPVTPLPRLLPDDCIIMNLKPGSKKDVLSQLVQVLHASSPLPDPDRFLHDLIDRETMVSTALADGVALPHVRDPESTGVKHTRLALGLCRPGTDFDSLDGGKTQLLFLLCAWSAASHLRLLAKLTLMLREPDIVPHFLACTTKREIRHILMGAHFNISILF